MANAHPGRGALVEQLKDALAPEFEQEKRRTLAALLDELALCKEKADLFDMLEEALGHPNNGTLQTLTVTKCEDLGSVRIQEIRHDDRQVYISGGNNLLEAARTMALCHPYDEEL